MLFKVAQAAEVPWRYEEVLHGNTYQGFVMDGTRVVVLVRQSIHVPRHCNLSYVADRDENIVGSRGELCDIVKRHNEAAEAAGG